MGEDVLPFVDGDLINHGDKVILQCDEKARKENEIGLNKTLYLVPSHASIGINAFI